MQGLFDSQNVLANAIKSTGLDNYSNSLQDLTVNPFNPNPNNNLDWWENPTALQWGGLGLNAAQGLFNGWLGMRQLDMAKKNFNENKRQFNLNFGAQRNLTNSQLEDRQRTRRASQPGQHEDVASYMAKWGV